MASQDGREKWAKAVGEMFETAFNEASARGFYTENCCSKHMLIVDIATDEPMYEVDLV